MAIKIQWQDPESTDITEIQIDRSSTKYGTYTTIATIDATSDGAAKTSANTWVTSYIDTTGTTTSWYKLKFYDGTNLVWSDYSEPITGKEEIKLCSVDDIKKVIDTVGRWTDDELFDSIIEIEEEIYIEMGTPIKSIYSPIGSIDSTKQDTYYVGEENIYRIDRVFYGTTSKHEYFLDDGYKANTKYGMIKLMTVASGGPTLNTNCEVEIRYVPRIYNRIATYRTAKFLLEQTDYSNSGKVSKDLEVINNRLNMVETIQKGRIGVVLSSSYENYDPVYGVNRTKLTQDHDKNAYIASYGW